jgi:murein DD-endopeptidase MepM/ murein hydrolase activator NlpD
MPRISRRTFLAHSAVLAATPLLAGRAPADDPQPALKPLVRTVDLNVGAAEEVELADGRKVAVRVLDLRETRDEFRNAVREADVKVGVAGTPVSLVSANYRLPVTVAGVQIDCPVTKGYRQKNAKGDGEENPWALDRDVRLRLWTAGSPLMEPGTFVYPARQRWFASATQMANEPVYVDGGENPRVKQIYYHYGLDIGGAEGLVEVVSATDGLVVSSGKAVLPGHQDSPVQPRYDVVYVLDGRGWYYRYSHLHSIDAEVTPGARLKMGQRVGLLGKEGGSGGWSHLHFDVSGRQPSGRWGIIEGYAFLWEAYLRQYRPKLLAVSRPHRRAAVGDKVVLDGSRSWAASGKVAAHDWTFTDGTTATGAVVERAYRRPGVYSEVLKVRDGEGRVDFDFAIVNVLDRDHPDRLPPTVHAAYAPTFGLRPGDPVTFLVRTFRTQEGKETWDFGDGSPQVEVHSDGNAVPLAKDGYARTVHRYEKPGHYLVRVERTDGQGLTATARLQVRVGQDENPDK